MEDFDKWYFGDTKGTFYKYSRGVLDDKEELKKIRASAEYTNMMQSWLASNQSAIEKLEKLISISQDKPGIDKEQRIWNAHYREGLRVAIAKLKEE